MVCNFDLEYERHNNFLNDSKHTTLLRSTAATSLDVAIAPVTTALLSIDGPACHP